MNDDIIRVGDRVESIAMGYYLGATGRVVSRFSYCKFYRVVTSCVVEIDGGVNDSSYIGERITFESTLLKKIEKR